MDKTKLDLACGGAKKEGFTGVDIADIEGVDIVHDLNIYPWPFEDGSVEEINCSHYVEHIPHLGVQAALKASETFEEFKLACKRFFRKRSHRNRDVYRLPHRAPRPPAHG